MRYLTILVTTALLTTGLAQADESLHLRYQADSGPMTLTLTLTQEIEVRQPVASRAMSFDVTLANLTQASASLLIGSSKASYTAHDMEQRLSTRHLPDSKIALAILEDGRHLAEVEPDDAPLIDMGPPVMGGFSVAGLLIDMLPRLPNEPVSVGTSWTTEQNVRLLEGWNWVLGEVVSRHSITAIEDRGGHTIVTIETEGEAELHSDEGDPAYSGELKRSSRWTFDATGGRVLSMSIEQETEGTGTLPQGELPIHQVTHFELMPSA